MKKVLLSTLLALLCSVKVFAQSGPCHEQGTWKECIREINGVTYIVLTFNCLPPGSTTFLDYQSTAGWTGYIAPCSTGVEPYTFLPELWYCIQDDFPLPEGCVPIVWENNFHAGAHPDTACPCDPCNANFHYCVSLNTFTNQWDVTVNMDEYTAPYYFLNIGSGYNQVTPPFTLNLNGGSYTLCMKAALGESGAEAECVACMDLCFPALKPANQTTAIGSENAYFTGVKIYPNPANNTAQLEFELVESERLNIQLLDISGRIVKTITNEEAKAGYHTIEINTEDVPSGMYIIKMETGKTSANFRLSVIK